jgi:phage shock protein A
VKTQVAIAIADQHLLEKKQKENLESEREWVRKAELALEKNQEDLARAALERSLTHENAAKNFAQQIEDQSHQVQIFKDALHRLEQKMTETRAKSELLIAEHRRARLVARSGVAAFQDLNQDAAFDRVRLKVAEEGALGHGQLAVNQPDVEERFAMLEKADQVDRLLEELKGRTTGQH